MKRPKSEVDFEHPAKGPHHCSECRHFERPRGCEEVQGRIDGGDWCELFALKKTLRQTITEATESR